MSTSPRLVEGYGRYKDDPNHVGCPRAKTDMTPCVARDGHLAADDTGLCVGCAAHPANLLTNLVKAVTTVGEKAHFESDRHALYVGWVLGCAMRAGIKITPVRDDEDNYTDRLIIEIPDRQTPAVYTITVVIPPPPDDWTFEEASDG
jgi:hypothetical protein